MPDCFIIMPISTPEVLVPAYGNDAHHFQHVLDCLFIPAVKKVGLNPIPPIAKGADVIQAGIVQNLEKNDLVLCDMSSLNANVFFELGIRTAIGKPVCVVKDEVTQKVPFDMTAVNYYTYLSTLAPWSLDEEIKKLSDHIKESMERSAGENLLWKYFSLSQRAQLPVPTPKDETHDRLQLISSQIEGLSKKFDNVKQQPRVAYNPPISDDLIAKEREQLRNDFLFDLMKVGTKYGFRVASSSWNLNDPGVSIDIQGEPDDAAITEISKMAEARGLELRISVTPAQPARYPRVITKQS